MKIDKYVLDEEQYSIVKDTSNYLLVVAGAGSGKTLTILGKINYLVNELGYKEDEILCISFTKASSLELENKIKKMLNINIEVNTFHKLGINIINNKISICDNELLDNIIYHYLFIDVLNNDKQKKMILKLLGKKFTFKINYLKYINSSPNTKILIKNISTFIRLFKCNGYGINKFEELLKKKDKKKYKIFLLITFNIYLIYNDYLVNNQEYDFDDLIIKATNKLDKKYKNYKYIIIDEYQDTSLIRFKLIKKIVDLNKAKIMAVGDDFQSIYRFTGCNIDLFTNFSKYYKDAKIMYIPNTYRNSQELIDIAGRFVMRNKYQIKKVLKSSKHLDKPVKIIYYNNLIKEIEKIINMIDGNILILGRNNNDVFKIIDNNTFKYKDNKIIYKNRNISYLTVHKSKGLECDNVIVINLEDNVLGFPSKLKENNTLKDIISEEKYPFSEERRLFYVAITRTRNYVYLLSPYINRSCFIKELELYKDVEKINKKIM